MYQASDVLVLLERHRIEDDWGDARLYDLRALDGSADRRRSSAVHEAGHANRPHGPEASSERSDLYALACTYAALAQALRIEVFRDAGEAAHWLAAQTNGVERYCTGRARRCG